MHRSTEHYIFDVPAASRSLSKLSNGRFEATAFVQPLTSKDKATLAKMIADAEISICDAIAAIEGATRGAPQPADIKTPVRLTL